MVERIQELIENVKEQGRLLQNAELMQLQSQINPHFLYNSFYLIRIMAKMSPMIRLYSSSPPWQSTTVS